MLGELREAIQSLHFFDWMTIALLVIGIIITTVSGSWIQKNEFEISSGTALERCAIDRKRIWLRASIIWYCINYVFLLFGFVCTIVLIYMAYTLEDAGNAYQIRVVIYSGMSLFVSITPHVLQPMNKSKGFRNANINLDAALIEGNEAKIKTALVDGEKIIRETHYS